MKKLAVVLLVALFAVTAQAATYTVVAGSAPFRTVFSASQLLTAAAPTAATEGVPVPPNVQGCYVAAQSQAASTLTNLVLTAYTYEPSVALWGKSNVINGIPVAGGTAAVVGQINVTAISDRTFFTHLPMEFVKSLPKSGRIDFISTGSTASAGTNITVFISCW